MKLLIAASAGLLATAAGLVSTSAECELWGLNRHDGTWIGETSDLNLFRGCNFRMNKNVQYNTHASASTSGDRNTYAFNMNSAAFMTLCDRDSCINWANQNPDRRWDGDRDWSDRSYGCNFSPGYADVNWNSNTNGVDTAYGQVPVCLPSESGRTVRIGYECSDFAGVRNCPSGSYCYSGICHEVCNSNSDPRDGFYSCLWNTGNIPDGNHCSQGSHCASSQCVDSLCVATDAPTDAPTLDPTDAPTSTPTVAPTSAPTLDPTDAPTGSPTASHVDTATALAAYGSGSFVGVDGDDVYHCSDAHDGCLVNNRISRSQWTRVTEVPYQADDSMQPFDSFAATTSDGKWATEPGAITFRNEVDQYAQKFPASCDCQSGGKD